MSGMLSVFGFPYNKPIRQHKSCRINNSRPVQMTKELAAVRLCVIAQRTRIA